MVIIALLLLQNGWKLDYQLTQVTADEPKLYAVRSHYVPDAEFDKRLYDKVVLVTKVDGGKTTTFTLIRTRDIYQFIKAVEGEDPVEVDDKQTYDMEFKRIFGAPPDLKNKVDPPQHKKVAGIPCTLYHTETKAADGETFAVGDLWYPDDMELREKFHNPLEQKIGLRKNGKFTPIIELTTTEIKLGKLRASGLQARGPDRFVQTAP